jgi:peptidyl-prolyl cis-trans isomerase C
LGGRAGAFVILAAASFICFSCAKEPEQGVLAKVGGTSITETDLEKRMEGMPAYMRRQFEKPEGRKRLLDGLVEEELYYKEAKATGLDKREDLRKEMARAERNVLIRHFFDKVIEARSAVPDSEVVVYYGDNPDEFRVGEGDSLRPFADVKDDIAARLSYIKRRKVHDDLVTELYAKYGVKVEPDSVLLSEVGPDTELASVDGETITYADLDARLKTMPAYMQEQFNSPQGKKRLLDGVVEENLFYREAKARGLDKQDDYVDEMGNIKRNILVKAYFDEMMEERSVPTEDEIAAYYEEHKDDFSYNEYARARHILVATEAEARRIYSRLAEGADFAALARKYSIDPMSRENGGLIAQVILPQQGVQGLGQVPEFTKACFSLDIGEASQPVKTAKGYHIIKVEERGTHYIMPLEEARDDVVSRLSIEKRQDVQADLLAELKNKYEVVYVTDIGTPSPEDLFKLASESSNPREKIRYYEQFLEEYPENERAYEAKFMIGFTYAEDLKNQAEAEKVFREFLEEFPESDLGDDARWMLDNMKSGGHPEFESEAS